jgi:hypothetical protein
MVKLIMPTGCKTGPTTQKTVAEIHSAFVESRDGGEMQQIMESRI